MNTLNNWQVALLRGINLGRAKRVAMADLRAIIRGLGFKDVQTLLNSGNAVFAAPNSSAAESASLIERALVDRLGLSAKVIVLTAAEFKVIIEENRLVDVADNPSRLLVMVLADPHGIRLLAPLLEQDWSPEALALGQRAAYLWCPQSILASRLPEAAGRLLGDAVTTRNWSTITRIQALLNQK